MASKVISHTQKISITQAVADVAYDIDTHPSLALLAKKVGGVSYDAIKKWARADDEIAEILSAGVFARAEAYSVLAAQAIKELDDEFWEAPALDNAGNIVKLTKERLTLVNKVKLKVEHYRWFMMKLAPDVYGDYYHELKILEIGYKEMQKQLDKLTNSTNDNK